MSWHRLKENKEKVRERLKRRKWDDVSLTGWGRLDEFIYFLHGLGYFKILQRAKLEILRTGIPHYLLLSTFSMKILLGIPSVRKVKENLFREKAVLKLLGYTVKQIEKGFNRRNRGKSKPINVDDLRNILKKVSPRAAEKIFEEVLKRLVKKKIIRGTVYALDATEILVTGKTYENYGEVVKVEQILKKNGEIREKKTRKRGYKAIILQNITKGREIIVGVIVVPLNKHEINYAERIVKRALKILGKGAIKTLVMDRGFLDGKLMHQLKKKKGPYKIDTIIPLKKNMNILQDMKELSRIEVNYRYVDEKRKLEILGFTDLETLDSYPGKLNGLLVKKKRKEWGYITTLPVKDVLKLYKLYKRRWVIENEGIRELKQGWLINKLPGRQFRMVSCHIIFTCMMYNLVKVFKSKSGGRITEKGIRDLRVGSFRDNYQVVVESRGEFGMFDIEEYTALFIGPPENKSPPDTVKIYIPRNWKILSKRFGFNPKDIKPIE